MPIFDLLGAGGHALLHLLELGVRHWPKVAAGYLFLTLFGLGQKRRVLALTTVAWPIVGFVAVAMAYRRSAAIRWVVRVATLAGWLWIVRLVDWPGRTVWLAATLALILGHLLTTYGPREIAAGTPINPRTYYEARRLRLWKVALRRGLATLQDERARVKHLAYGADGLLLGHGTPAPGKSPGDVATDAADETLGNAVNTEAELLGLGGVNVHVERSRGADGGVSFLMWEPDKHPLRQDLPWPGPHPAAADDPVPIGIRLLGGTYTIPCPGVDGKFLLIGGTTGGGKSTTVSVILGELAMRPHTDFIICDPKMTDFSWLWGDRALHIAEGPDEAAEATAFVFAEMMRRRRWAREHSMRAIVPGLHHEPDDCDICARHRWTDRAFSRLHLVVDEMADIRLGSAVIPGTRTKVGDRFEAQTQQIAATGRAQAIGQILCTQYPKANIVPVLTRGNCRVRICFATEEGEATEAILGSQKIPADKVLQLPGECFGKQDRELTRLRGWYATDAQLEDVIARSKHLRGDLPEVTATEQEQPA